MGRILPLLPRTVTQPIVEKRDPDAFPVLTIALTADKPVRDITVRTRCCAASSKAPTASARRIVLGGRRRQINVWLGAERLRAQNLTVNDVARALQTQNSDIPGGRLDQGARSVTMRTRGRVDLQKSSARSSCARSAATRCSSRRRPRRGRGS